MHKRTFTSLNTWSVSNSLTCSAVGLPSGSFCRQASINEQNSGEKSFFDGDGDGSSKIFKKIRYVLHIQRDKHVGSRLVKQFAY